MPWWLRDENSKAIACMSVCVCVVQLGTVEKARVGVREKESDLAVALLLVRRHFLHINTWTL